jgi:gentisate 1,2-dioxygenase
MSVADAKIQHERLEALNQEMARHFLGGYWQPRTPHPILTPIVWPWSTVVPCLKEAGEVVGLGDGSDEAFRRVVQLVNPGLVAQKSTCRTLQVSFQLVQPGEIAECHRHTAAALRFIVEGDGTAFTNVDGEQMLMEPGDLVLTPNWAWHNHENPGQQPVIWLDVLDVHLTTYLNAAFREDYVGDTAGERNVSAQPVTRSDGYCRQALGNIRPRLAHHDPRHVLPYTYKWRDVLQALTTMAAAGQRDPYDGVILEYVNPLTGGPTMPTIACHVQLLAPGETTRRHRHACSTVYYVVEGEGASAVTGKAGGEEPLEWQTRDCFFVPPNVWHHHRNKSGTDAAILFSVTDRPVLEGLGLYREEIG